MGSTPLTLGGRKKFGGEPFSFVSNFSTKRQAEANVRVQQRAGMSARIWAWTRREDGKILYSVWVRRRKDFWTSPKYKKFR